MKLSRLVLIAAAIAAAFWAVRHRDEILNRVLPASAKSTAPAARTGDDALTEASREADRASGGGVSENMTPDQVRAILGAPDEIQPGSAESGRPRERWIYRQAGKAVVFENGVAVSIEAP